MEELTLITKIAMSVDKFEHLLECMAEQKYLHKWSPENQREKQVTIDAAYDEAMDLVKQVKKFNIGAEDKTDG